MKKPVSLKAYKTFCIGRTFFNGLSYKTHIAQFHAAFIKVFYECRHLLTAKQAEKVAEIAQAEGEDAAREYIEANLVKGMGDIENA